MEKTLVEQVGGGQQRRVATPVRIWNLPAILLTNAQGEYVELLIQSRDLCVDGKFYACVAMCGIVADTVSMFKDFDIKDGALARKN